jgi:hypothetical protein
VTTARESSAFNHDAHALVAAHRIDSDTRQTHGQPPKIVLVLSFDRDDLTTVVVAASVAEVVRALQFAAVRAFVECFDLQSIVAAAHAPAGRGRFSFRDSHFGTCSWN